MKLYSTSSLTVRKLSIEELDVYMSFIEYVKDFMAHPEWLGDFTKEDYVTMLNNNTEIYIWVFPRYESKKIDDFDQIIACGSLIPARKKDLDSFLQTDLNAKEVVDFGPEAVHPRYIGNGLQSMVIQYLSKVAVEAGYKYGLGTVHPDNEYSKNNLEKNGFQLVTTVFLKRGPRDVLRKKLI